MEGKKLNIAFVWHMHQPLYKDPLSGDYAMPWVLLHGTKDYLDMVSILDEFPNIHQTFNIVPCLIEQITDYAEGVAKDRYINLTLKPADELTTDDKVFLLKNFFQANWDNMIKPFPRYWELLHNRGLSSGTDDLIPVARYFSRADWLDLQVLFNLAWIDPHLRAQDAELSALCEKGRDFTEADKAVLIKKQSGILAKILPKYAEMQEKGIIEISTSPYYHPIMPLLLDSFCARTAMPDVTLPKERFSHPEDVTAQITKGVALYKKVFGCTPEGMWPSEGSVSAEILPLARAEGIKWLASDEEILTNSLEMPLRRDAYGNCLDAFIYKPYSINTPSGPVSMVFRDRVLSDLIGFDYAKMHSDSASDDFIGRLTNIYNLFDDPQSHIVTIILDGENAWENYKNDGRDFLHSLYSKLSKNNKFDCVTLKEFFSRARHDSLSRLYPGSWINHNFRIWIGHHEDNSAWDLIADARSAVVKYSSVANAKDGAATKTIQAAWDEIYASEGSDWFWWYGDEHSSLSDEQFDILFRSHLKRVYMLISKEPPVALDIPIMTEEKGFSPESKPSAYINPVIDGEITNYFEWLASGRLKHVTFGTAMHKEQQSGGFIEAILYGFSKKELFFRFDCCGDPVHHDIDWSFTLHTINPVHVKITGVIQGDKATALVQKRNAENDDWVDAPESGVKIAIERVLELAVPLDLLGVKSGEELRFFIDIDAGERCLERWPVKGFIALDTPTENFESENWMV
ncbi:hypothetical protein EPN18_04150 [bacterium]|nr:MAG: hypothetical protein EPN18_04150 [bacterium]